MIDLKLSTKLLTCLHVYIIFMYHEMVQQDTSQSISDIHNYDAFDTILPVILLSSIQAWCVVHGV